MQFNLAKDALQKALQRVQSAIDAKSVIPLLSCVKIIATEGKVLLTTTNLDMEASEEILTEVIEEGEVAVAMAFFNDVIKRMPSGSIINMASHEVKEERQLKEGEEAAQKVTLSANKIKIGLGALSAGKFPKSLADANYDIEFEVESKDIQELLKKTQFCISNDYEPITLNSFLLHTIENEEGKIDLCGVTTDGKRLGFCKIKTAENLPLFNKIIPRRGINELYKLAQGYSGKIKIFLSDNRASFMVDKLRYTIKLGEGKFPDYKKVVPVGNTKILEVNRKELIDAFERVFVIYRVDNLRGVKIAIEHNIMTLSAYNNNGDMAEETLEIEFSDAEPFATFYDPKFILESLQHIDSVKVRLSFSAPLAPLLATTPGDDSFYYVIMPIRS